MITSTLKIPEPIFAESAPDMKFIANSRNLYSRLAERLTRPQWRFGSSMPGRRRHYRLSRILRSRHPHRTRRIPHLSQNTNGVDEAI
ncbi:hypothetical protein N7462_005290 [Penicillium macrosclerotiorum]|uniref:uncharacterized protein n=1 Tax=Penicillium macrosclerotiorum TaxID=303699 RepID=UPI002547BF94|nr:uncharacterized protein N7462_005290 [Penicillium macrosclerotiorum]KAJ5690898.1 hypothetical protein N7462_005290 [Penicillium macrosclerotiorum]